MDRHQKVSLMQFFLVVLSVIVTSVFLGKSLPRATVEELLASSLEYLSEQHFETLVSSGTVAGSAVIVDTDVSDTDPTLPATESAVVSRIIDGDTVELSTGEVLRYIGINTPESKHPQKGVECFAQEATQANERLVLGKTVQLEQDVSSTDRYGRLLRYVWIDEMLLNEELVLQGYAHASAYPPDVKYQKRLSDAEVIAREQKRGLWAECLL